MDLDELKSAWSELNNNLNTNKALKGRIVKEILHSKTNKALSRLYKFDFVGLIVCFIALPFLIFQYGITKHTFWSDIMAYCAMGIIICGCITQSYKSWLLLKINLNNSICENIRFLQKYNLFIKREKMSTYIIIPIIFIIIILGFINLGKIETWRWIAVISILVLLPILCIWQYKKVYDSNIQSIKKSLEELKELEEEVE